MLCRKLSPAILAGLIEVPFPCWFSWPCNRPKMGRLCFLRFLLEHTRRFKRSLFVFLCAFSWLPNLRAFCDLLFKIQSGAERVRDYFRGPVFPSLAHRASELNFHLVLLWGTESDNA